MKNKKRKKNAASDPSAYLGVKAWAFFVRYGMDLLPLPFLILAKAGQIPERAGLLISSAINAAGGTCTASGRASPTGG